VDGRVRVKAPRIGKGGVHTVRDVATQEGLGGRTTDGDEMPRMKRGKRQAASAATSCQSWDASARSCPRGQGEDTSNTRRVHVILRLYLLIPDLILLFSWEICYVQFCRVASTMNTTVMDLLYPQLEKFLSIFLTGSHLQLATPQDLSCFFFSSLSQSKLYPALEC